MRLATLRRGDAPRLRVADQSARCRARAPGRSSAVGWSCRTGFAADDDDLFVSDSARDLLARAGDRQVLGKRNRPAAVRDDGGPARPLRVVWKRWLHRFAARSARRSHGTCALRVEGRCVHAPATPRARPDRKCTLANERYASTATPIASHCGRERPCADSSLAARVAPYVHALSWQDLRGRLPRRDSSTAGHLMALVQDLSLLHAMGIRLSVVHGSRPQVQRTACVERRRGALSTTTSASPTPPRSNAPRKRRAKFAWTSKPRFRRDCRTRRWRTPRYAWSSGNFVTARPLGVIDGIDLELHRRGAQGRRPMHPRCTLANGAIVLLSPLGLLAHRRSFQPDDGRRRRAPPPPR